MAAEKPTAAARRPGPDPVRRRHRAQRHARGREARRAERELPAGPGRDAGSTRTTTGFPGLLAGEVSKRGVHAPDAGVLVEGLPDRPAPRPPPVRPARALRRGARGVRRRASTPSREAACRQLFFDLLWPVTTEGRSGPAHGIVEQSCDVIAQAPTLVRLFPEARFVHVVRDGRDASASRVSQRRWLVYPRTRRQGLEWWERRIRAIDAGAKAIEPGRFLELGLDDFLVRGAPQGRGRGAGARSPASAPGRGCAPSCAGG